MAETRQSRKSPLIKIHPPTSKPLAAEEKIEEADKILRRLQNGSMPSMPSLGSCVTVKERRKSCMSLGLSKNNEDTKTIRAKVKSTENLNQKSLIGADLLKNLKRIQTKNQSQQIYDTRRCQTAEVYTRTSLSGNASHVRSRSAVIKNSSSAGLDLQQVNSTRRGGSSARQNLVPEARNGNRLLLRRGSLPVGNLNSKSGQADAILGKYNFGNRLNQNYDNISNATNSKNRLKIAAETVKATFPVIKRVRSAGYNLDEIIRDVEDEENYKKQNTRSNLTPNRRSSVVNTSTTSILSCGSDGVDGETCPTDTSDCDSKSETTKSSVRTSNSSKRMSKSKSKKSGSDSDSSDNDVDDETDEDEVTGSETRSKKTNECSTKSRRKPSIVNCNDHNNNNDDDADDSDTACIDESRRLTDQPISSKRSLPGMPAVDTVETWIHPGQPQKGRSQSMNSEADLADDVDDLIDAIDDLIEADDEDITYEASQARKTKSFKKTVSLVMAAKKMNKS